VSNLGIIKNLKSLNSIGCKAKFLELLNFQCFERWRYKTTHGIYHILKCTQLIYYGAACHIDKALEIEARYFVDLQIKLKILFALSLFY
jgi:hypothetical protein